MHFAVRRLTIAGALSGRRHIGVAALAIAVVASLASAGLAFGPGGGTESGQLSLPPNSNGMAETSALLAA